VGVLHGGSIAAPTVSAVSWPRSARIGLNAIPDIAAADATSTPAMWAVASHTTRWPDRTRMCMAISFAMVPVAT